MLNNNENLIQSLNDKQALRTWAQTQSVSGRDFDFSSLKSFLTLKSKPGQNWGVFKSIQNEPHIHILDFQDLGLQFIYPKVTESGLKFYKSENFKKTRLGILEPIGGLEVSKKQIHGLLIPGLVFDTRGYRLGRGSAHYDRYLTSFTGLKVGLTWKQFLISAALPKEDWDIAMDFIVTEHFFYQPMTSLTKFKASALRAEVETPVYETHTD